MAALFADLTTLEWIYLALFCSGLIYALFLAVFGFGIGHGAGLDHGGAAGHGVDLGHGGGVGHGVDLGHGGAAGHGADFGHGSAAGHGADFGHGGAAGDGADFGHGGAHAGAGHGAGHAVAADHGDMGTESQGQPVHASPWNPLVIATFIGGVGGFGILGTRLFGLRSLLSLLIAFPAGLVMAGIIFGLYVLLISQAGGSSAATWQDIRGASGSVLTPIPEQGLGEVVYVARGSRFAAPARSVDGRAIPTGTNVTVLDVDKTAVIVDVRYTDE